MSLAARFRWLVGIFGVSIVANVLVSVICIHFYIRVATERFGSLKQTVRDTEQIRGLIDDLTADLWAALQREEGLRSYWYSIQHAKISRRIAALELPRDEESTRAIKTELVELSGRLAEQAEALVAFVEQGDRDKAAALLEGGPIESIARRMNQLLDAVARDSDLALVDTSRQVTDQGTFATAILSANAIVAFLLAATAVHLVRNWVLKPVAALKLAAERHAAGDLEYRVASESRDELGSLAREVDRMAEALIAIQRRLVEQERMAAVGEVASSVAHNIRNPLAGIRASAQSSLGEVPEEAEVHKLQMRIIETVDSLSRWLRELLMVSKPITLERHGTSLRELVDGVCRVLAASAERRGIALVIHEAPPGCRVDVDPMRMEQAILSIVDNAIEASPAGREVRIAIGPAGDGAVEIRVSDSGPGIPPEVMQRIASAYFSTKPGGTGIGLHLAKRTIQAHGGSLGFENDPASGTTVTLRLPGPGDTN